MSDLDKIDNALDVCNFGVLPAEIKAVEGGKNEG